MAARPPGAPRLPQPARVGRARRTAGIGNDEPRWPLPPIRHATLLRAPPPPAGAVAGLSARRSGSRLPLRPCCTTRARHAGCAPTDAAGSAPVPPARSPTVGPRCRLRQCTPAPTCAVAAESNMTKRMLISVDRDESRAAVVDDGQLIHLEIEPVSRNTCKGNLYRATVARVEPSLQSAFVDFGNDKQGFLPVGEIHPRFKPKEADKRAPIQEVLKHKAEILVQVVRDEIGQKGATLSTFVSLPGRYLVLIPESDKTGISRKLSDEARDRIKKLTDTMKVPEGFGLIVRTAGETATELELQKDLLYLSRQWEAIQKKFNEVKGPTLLYAERSLPVRFVRDYFTKDIEEVVIDDDGTLQEVSEFLSVLMPHGLSAVTRYQGDMPLFARYGVEGKVEDVFARQVFLDGGGSIVIDQTEALVAIDVNSGRVKEKDIEETARASNIEAAEEIARQLILRDLGGLIVVDFIDMREKKYVKEVEHALKEAFKNDKARTKIGHISEFGLLEMSRQRIKSSVNKGTFDACVNCSGTGRARAMESVAMSVLRRIYETCSTRRVRYVVAMMPAQAARYLLNARRQELATVEKHYHLTIEVVPVDGMTASQVVLEHLEEVPAEPGAERADRLKVLRVTQELDLVRNMLVKREEVRIGLEAALKREGRVDIQELYKEVRAMTVADLEPAPSRGRGRRHGPGASHAVHSHDGPQVESMPAGQPTSHAAVVGDAVPVPRQPPKPRGFATWFKSLFGLAESDAHAPDGNIDGAGEPALPTRPRLPNAVSAPHAPVGTAGPPSGASPGASGRSAAPTAASGGRGSAPAFVPAGPASSANGAVPPGPAPGNGRAVDADFEDGDGGRRRRRRRRGGRGPDGFGASANGPEGGSGSGEPGSSEEESRRNEDHAGSDARTSDNSSRDNSARMDYGRTEPDRGDHGAPASRVAAAGGAVGDSHDDRDERGSRRRGRRNRYDERPSDRESGPPTAATADATAADSRAPEAPTTAAAPLPDGSHPVAAVAAPFLDGQRTGDAAEEPAVGPVATPDDAALAVPVEEASVDVRALKQAMIEQLASESAAQPVQAAAGASANAPIDAPKTAKNRFVVDLRTGSR
ncbi:MAG: Rne/Rng family ribonuclease [Myxococcales bacterium]|nr:Rne/Rng family ribonuclease [Myxococcales bacterium]